MDEERLHARLGTDLSDSVPHGPCSEDHGLVDSFGLHHGGLKS